MILNFRNLSLKEIIMTGSEKAISDFSKGYNCAQSVFSAFSEVVRVDEDLSRSIASGVLS